MKTAPPTFIVVTGAAGFIGSVLAAHLAEKGEQLILVDDFSRADKNDNWRSIKHAQLLDRSLFPQWLMENGSRVRGCYHLGARTDTTEMDYDVHRNLNLEYSKKVWNACVKHHIPLVYASSAATYGDGSLGYKDSHDLPARLQPLNPYGISKNEFDIWALQQQQVPPYWAGMKFFNVYGPNEYHKGRMASVIWHTYQQVKSSGAVKLFRSHRADFKDGEQIRDFIYVKDVVTLCQWMMEHQPQSGLYNLGTGRGRSFNDLVKAVFNTLQLPYNIEYIDTPEDIRDKYQYFTEADMSKVRNAGFAQAFHTLEEGINDYVSQYLMKGLYFSSKI